MANKSALVEQIKSIQRSDAEAKQAWWDYCDTNLGGVKDPNRHEANVLQDFISAYGSGGLEAKPQKRRPGPDMGGGGFLYGQGPGAYGGGCPGYGYMQGGASYDGWSYPAFPGQWGAMPSDSSMASMVKTGQRRSQNWKNAWQAYCSLYGNNYNDPNKYDENFIVGFLDYVGQLALADLGTATPAAAEGPVGSGVKRPLVGPSAAAAQPPAKRLVIGPTPGYDAEKNELVEKIKTLQRSDPEAKNAWWAFCDEFQQGIKDPNRHDAQVLQKFLQGYE